MSTSEKHPLSQLFNLTVLVAALGYFVDMLDLLLFPIVRQPSLLDLGVPPGDAPGASWRASASQASWARP